MAWWLPVAAQEEKSRSSGLDTLSILGRMTEFLKKPRTPHSRLLFCSRPTHSSVLFRCHLFPWVSSFFSHFCKEGSESHFVLGWPDTNLKSYFRNCYLLDQSRTKVDTSHVYSVEPRDCGQEKIYLGSLPENLFLHSTTSMRAMWYNLAPWCKLLEHPSLGLCSSLPPSPDPAKGIILRGGKEKWQTK